MATVDVLVPTYNRSAMLRQCLGSRQAQTYTDIRVIIGDDCSDDDTRTVAQDFCGMDGRFYYVRNAARLGIFGNTNTLFTRATGISGSSCGKGEYVLGTYTLWIAMWIGYLQSTRSC